MADAAQLLDPKKYRIVRSPDLQSVSPDSLGQLTPDASVQYEVVGPRTAIASQDYWGPAEYVRWFVFRERTTDGRTDYSRVADLGFGWVKAFTWDVRPGKYLVLCEIRSRLHRSKEALVCLTLEQHVMSEDEVESVLAVAVGKARKAGLANPDEADGMLAKHIDNLQAIAARGKKKLTPAQLTRHNKHIEQLTEYRAKTAALLESTKGHRRVALPAVHIEYATGQQRQLNFFLAWMGSSDGSVQWRLIDWTNPVARGMHSQSDGEGETHRKAIEDAFSDWDWWRGRYPPGMIKFIVPFDAFGEVLHFTLQTDGETTWDTIIGYLETAAMAGALVAIGVATLGAAVPFEAAACAATYSIVFSSVTGAGAEVLSIMQRRGEGIHDPRADAFSTLSIIGSIFAAPEKAWVKGATLVLGPSRGVKAGRYIFVGAVGGQYGVDAAQGVLIAEQSYREYDEILNNNDLLPEERERQLRELFRKLVIAGAMTSFAINGDRKQLKEVAEARRVPNADAITKHKISELRDPSKEIDTTEPKVTKGNTKERRTRTVANTEEPRLKGKLPFRDFPSVSNTRQFGISPKEHAGFASLSKDGTIYMVRSGSEARLAMLENPRFAGQLVAKTDKVKFKTNKNSSSEFWGVVCAGPDDPHMIDLCERNNWSLERDLDQIRAYVKKNEGLTIGDAPDYVIRNGQGKMFVSDIDLHGAYKRSTGAAIDTNSRTFQDEVNVALGAGRSPVVLHGGQADWDKRMIREVAAANYGPMPPVLAYVDGQCVRLDTWEDMKAFAKAYGLPLERQFPNFDFEKWVRNMESYPSMREQAAKERAAHERVTQQTGPRDE